MSLSLDCFSWAAWIPQNDIFNLLPEKVRPSSQHSESSMMEKVGLSQ